MDKNERSPFEGTAWYYSRYRPGIPDEVLTYLNDRFSFDGTGRCLDLGCGTGQLTRRLAPYFEQVVGMDPDPGMLIEARAGLNGEAQSENNILWRQRSAENIDADDGTFRLITICRAFVWMDQYKVLNLIKQRLLPNGGVAILGDGSFWSGKQDWQQKIKETVQKFLGEQRRAGNRLFHDSGESYTEMLSKSGFRDVLRADIYTTRYWSFSEILGCLYSTSFAAKWLFGNRLPEFESALYESLGSPDDSKRFIEEVEFVVQSGLRP